LNLREPHTDDENLLGVFTSGETEDGKVDGLRRRAKGG
jgi:hypothetical protein